ncbi:leucyl/phenylalanyl-tRNA--protein transferase [Deltaproteobacteria bacterium]|nr:leucyl/phenylalanyl-tRNA--protein transferase [Deltaproteobacteria bacterium]
MRTFAPVPVYRLIEDIVFPPPAHAEQGLLCVGGDLRPERLVAAYQQGIFPWYSEGEPIWWHSPDPRFVLLPEKLHVHRSLGKVIGQRRFEIRFDTAFADVIKRCGQKRRPGQRGTWITRDMQAAFNRLHELGLAHSAEAWQDGKLVGGLYGVSLGQMYFGESMFADVDDASKVAFVALVRWMQARGILLVDSQVRTDHVARFGGEEWPREQYLERLASLVHHPNLRGPWRIEAGDLALER